VSRARAGVERVLLAAALALAGCGRERTEPDEVETQAGASAAPLPSRPTVICAGLDEVILRTHPTREPLRAAYGDPDSTTTTVVPNRHVPGALDTLFTLHYPGLVAEVHTPSQGRDLADLVTVEDNRYLAIPSIGIGTTEEAVLAALGEPLRVEEGALVYWCGEGAEQPVRFELAGGRVRAVMVDYYVD
jgi:hypothetical protein